MHFSSVRFWFLLFLGLLWIGGTAAAQAHQVERTALTANSGSVRLSSPPTQDRHVSDLGATPSGAESLDFTVAGDNLTGVRFGSSSVGDIFGDGEADLLLTGETIEGLTSALYFGREGVFDPARTFTGVINSSSHIADLNGDGHADLLISGQDANEAPVTNLYLGDGTGQFSVADVGLVDLLGSASSIADFNDDGALDLFLTGRNASGEKEAKLYLGDGEGGFTEAGAEINAITRGSSSVADVDGDGNLDLLVTGESRGDAWSATLYLGDGEGGFTKAGAGLTGVLESSSAIGDVNEDGNPDLVITGRTEEGSQIATLYLGDGTGGFSKAGAGLVGVENSSSKIADVNDDGHLDLLITGDDASDTKTATLYLGDGQGGFTKAGAGLVGVTASSSNIADLDGDGDLDLLITGHDEALNPSARVYLQKGGGEVNISVTETVTVSDAPQVTPPASISVTETIGVADKPSVLPPASISITETVAVSDAPQATPPASIQVTETIAVTDAPSTAPVLAAESKSVSSNGRVDFGTTGTSIDFAGVSGSGEVTVTKFGNAPSGTGGISESHVSAYRFVIETGGNLSVGSGTDVRLDVSTLSGISDPANVTMYRRPKPRTGSFSEISTTYDSEKDELVGTTSSLSEFALASDTEPLPVDLVAFEAEAVGKQTVQLTWQTASETGNSGFEVQRRAGQGRGWTNVGFVEGAGTSTEPHRYQFEDEDVPYSTRTLTYRLKQVDTDGSVTYSRETEVELGAPDRLLLHSPFPNPVRQQATLRYELPQDGHVRLAVYNMLGQREATLVDERQGAGRHEIVFRSESLSSGVYYVRLSVDGTIRTQEMTVIR